MYDAQRCVVHLLSTERVALEAPPGGHESPEMQQTTTHYNNAS